MEEGSVEESHLTSAAAFVEGGIKDTCDDACSICLEAFSDNDPSTVTSCKHEFHLQCILEWCQRSSYCPMCWQSLSLKNPSSQELLEAVECERNVRMNPPRNTAIFHHSTLGDFELQHLPINASESELEERIIQHLAAAAAIGRARQLARREGHRNRTSTQGHPHLVVFSTLPDGAPTTSVPSPIAQREGNGPTPAVMLVGPTSPFISIVGDPEQLTGQTASGQPDLLMSRPSATNQLGASTNNMSPVSTPTSQDRAGPSDLQSFSETLKSCFSAFSVRYKESIIKSTRNWKEKLFTSNASPPEHPSAEAHRVINQGLSPGFRIMDHPEVVESTRTHIATLSNNFANVSISNPSEAHITGRGAGPSLSVNYRQAPCPTSSTSN